MLKLVYKVKVNYVLCIRSRKVERKRMGSKLLGKRKKKKQVRELL